MSGAETTKANSGWTDKERLTYLFALIENSNVKFDYNNTPRPAGRSIIACQRMMERMKLTLKNELEALMGGRPIEEGGGTPKKVSTPRKRKAKGEDAGSEGAATPSKRGRKKKSAEAVEEAAGEEEEGDGAAEVKPEPKDEEGGEEV